MKALTVWQPWASLIMAGVKPFEFRRWDYRLRFPRCENQRIVIHAGARKIKPGEVDELITRLSEYRGVGTGLKPGALGMMRDLYRNGCRGILAVGLGSVVLGTPRRCIDLFKGKVADSDRIDEHMWAWPMLELKPFDEPVPMRGHQGFWNWPA